MRFWLWRCVSSGTLQLHASSNCLQHSVPHAQELLPLLQPEQPGGVRVLSLYGMGGIGKSTLARELFSRLRSSRLRFSRKIILVVGQEQSLADRQQQLIRLLAGYSMPMASSAAELQQELEQCTQQAGPLLMALEDISTAAQRDALLCLNALADGSRVILTGRDSSSLHPGNEKLGCAARLVEALAPQQAEQLLCQHAFAADHAQAEYRRAVQAALAACGGVPSARCCAAMRSRTPTEAEVGHSRMLAGAPACVVLCRLL